tara:strand:+ start:500 stop:643 length:144 start_codon:yes stop_codon:yes gene_type:complete
MPIPQFVLFCSVLFCFVFLRLQCKTLDLIVQSKMEESKTLAKGIDLQ